MASQESNPPENYTFYLDEKPPLPSPTSYKHATNTRYSFIEDISTPTYLSHNHHPSHRPLTSSTSPKPPQQRKPRFPFRSTPNSTSLLPRLHHAIVTHNIPLIGTLLGAGAPLNKLDPESGLAPLHIAAVHSNPATVRALVHSGADVNLRDSRSGRERAWTPLHHAASAGRADLVGVLVRLGAELEARDRRGRTAVAVAAESAAKGDGLVGRLLCGEVGEVGTRAEERPKATTLRFSYVFDYDGAAARSVGGGSSASRGSLRNSQSCWTGKANRQSVRTTGTLRTHGSASSSVYDDCTVLEALIRAGARLDAQDGQGNTPLHLAVRAGRNENAEVLGAMNQVLWGVRNKAGRTPVEEGLVWGSREEQREGLGWRLGRLIGRWGRAAL